MHRIDSYISVLKNTGCHKKRDVCLVRQLYLVISHDNNTYRTHVMNLLRHMYTFICSIDTLSSLKNISKMRQSRRLIIEHVWAYSMRHYYRQDVTMTSEEVYLHASRNTFLPGTNDWSRINVICNTARRSYTNTRKMI